MTVVIKGDNGLDITTDGSNNPRIQGDFSNATLANRVAFQSSTTNGSTGLVVLPNGTGVLSQHLLFNNSDPTNAGALNLLMSNSDARIASTITGTGTYLPMTFYTGGSERMRIDTSGNVGVGAAPTYDLDVIKTKVGAATVIRTYNADTGATSSAQVQAVSGTVAMYMYGYGNSTGNIGTESNHQVNIRQGAATRVVLDTTGNTLHINANGGLGYGTGAGGTVTQATSKTTAVTLNKPTGQITMNNAALAAGARVTFVCNNSLVTTNDVVVISLSGGSVNPDDYLIRTRVLAGGFTTSVINQGAGSLSEAIVLNFAIIKGANA